MHENQPYAGSWLDADARPTRPMEPTSRTVSGRRRGSVARYLTVSALGAVMSLGAYALYQATIAWQADEAAKLAQRTHCEAVKSLVLSEADEALLHGRFPSLDQQDAWRQMMQACEVAEPRSPGR